MSTPVAMEPKFSELQSIYDVSDDFFQLFLGHFMSYSCGYYTTPTTTPTQAQVNKIRLALSKLDLQPGMTLLDVGCGWGACAEVAMREYHVNVIGLTLSKNQCEYARRRLANIDPQLRAHIRLEGWEEFNEPVDRVVSIGAFEHFGRERWDDFFTRMHRITPDDAVMLLHTITAISGQDEAQARGIPMTMNVSRFTLFIMKEIFPGGRLPSATMPRDYASRAGFICTHDDEIGLHYARTLSDWSQALQENKTHAIAMQGEATYNKYLRYLQGCASLFNGGYTSVHQYTLAKQPLVSITPSW